MTYARIGAVVAFIAVALGAFGAHLLRGGLDPALSRTFETAVRYQMFHALALIALDLVRMHTPVSSARARTAADPRSADTLGAPRTFDALGVAGILFVLGIVLFSGSLYALAITGVRGWGVLTPFGGLALLAGWIAFAIGCRRPPSFA